MPELSYFDVLGRFGMTAHPGGPRATERLVERCGLPPRAHVLDLGCGTGWTACHLAKEHGASVVGVDLTPSVLCWADERIEREGLGDRVTTRVADAHDLPFADATFDAVIAESVLVFTEPRRAAAEVRRVLKPGGAFGDDELVRRAPVLSEEARALLAGSVLGRHVGLLGPEEWADAFLAAGFAWVRAWVSPLSRLDYALLTPLRVDGPRRYLDAVVRSLADPELRAFDRESGRALLRLVFGRTGSQVGYGIFVAR